MRHSEKLMVKECGYSTIKHFFTNYHYLKRTPAGIMSCYGLYLTNNEMQPVGGAVFTNGRIQYDKIYIEFARLYLLNEIPKNSESWFIGKCLRSLQIKYPKYKGVVSWSDNNIGHSGGIYKASNFVFDGNSRIVKKYKSNTGRIVYQRTVVDEQKYERLKSDNPKRRWIYYFDKRKREFLKNDERTDKHI